MNKQIIIFPESERQEKKKALEALTPVEAMPLTQVPEIFHNPKDKTPKIIKLRKAWIFSHLQNTFPDSPIGKIIISKSGIHDSLFKGCNRFKAGLYPILDKLIESSILLYINLESSYDIQYVLGNK